MLQSAIVAITVVACFVYAAWQFMPKGLRSRLAGFLLQRTTAPALAPLASCLQAAQASSQGCGGCGGCSSSAGDAGGLGCAKPLRFQPRGAVIARSVPVATKQ